MWPRVLTEMGGISLNQTSGWVRRWERASSTAAAACLIACGRSFVGSRGGVDDMAHTPENRDGVVRQGEIARLLMQHRTALYGFIYACVRNHADTEDILQNVSVAVTESITQLKDEAGFLPWAREI